MLYTNLRFTLCIFKVFNSSFLVGERDRQKPNVSSSVAKHQKNGISCTCNYTQFICGKGSFNDKFKSHKSCNYMMRIELSNFKHLFKIMSCWRFHLKRPPLRRIITPCAVQPLTLLTEKEPPFVYLNWKMCLLHILS